MSRRQIAATACAVFLAAFAPLAAIPILTAATAASSSGIIGPSAYAVADIPAEYLALYQRGAATCPGLSWTILAAIGSVESGHGRNNGPSSAGALGPMQFLPSTWAGYGVDGDADGTADIMNPADAIPGAAKYLCRNGAGNPATLRNALWNYNHSQAYIELVLRRAEAYGSITLVAVSADAAALLANPNVTMTTAARGDVAAGIIDARVIAILSSLASRHTLTVAVLRTGHSPFIAGTTTYSNHYFGRGVDITRVDGESVSPGSAAARAAVIEILSIPLNSPLHPSETGHPWADLTQLDPGSFTNAAHQDHIHIGWDA
ncbi:MAG: lytic transglycosylase domain-containing protein [Acidimicrobiales bacterium]